MCVAHATDQALALALRQRNRQPACFLGRLAGGQDDFRDAAPQVASEVEARPPAKLVELKAPQLRQRVVLAELARYEPAQHVDRKSTRLNSSHSQISYAL